ncbi:hypothetical protein PG993_008130 [Apiospora rasikravindrae]|uniref:Uncharacterized protein n=1 Tax=Apiospora rasikravindrae TaxID=990691 RepID=A0ABR1SZH0_9PEZI
MSRVKIEETELGTVSQPPRRSLDSTLFGTRVRYLVSSCSFRWSTSQTVVFRAWVQEKYPNHKGCDVGPLLKALDLDGYEDMTTANGDSVYRLIVEKVRRKVANTEKLMAAEGSLTKKDAPQRVISFKETSPHAAAASQASGSLVNDLPTTPTHAFEPSGIAQVRRNPFSGGYHNDDDAQSVSSGPDSGGRYHLRKAPSHGVRMPNSLRFDTAPPSPAPSSKAAAHHYHHQQQQQQQQQQQRQRQQVDELHRKVKTEALANIYHGSTGPTSTPSFSSDSPVYGRGSNGGADARHLRGGQNGGGRGRYTKSARDGHLERMAETLESFGEEVLEAQQAPDESEEWESEIDSMRRLFVKMVQKLEKLELLPPAEE